MKKSTELRLLFVGTGKIIATQIRKSQTFFKFDFVNNTKKFGFNGG